MNRYVPSPDSVGNGRVVLARGRRCTVNRRVPDNSTPWFNEPPRTLAKVFGISDQIKGLVATWVRNPNPS